MFKPQTARRITRAAFFMLYALAPVFDLLRFDLNSHQFYFLRYPVHLGIDAFRWWEINTFDMLINFAEIIFFPVAIFIAIGAFISWRWGLIYCGWFCPHESVVEIVNHLMRRASGKITVWDRKTLPETQLDGTHIKPEKKWWWVTGIVIVLLAFIWAITLLSYLLPPAEVYSNLIHLSFTRNQTLFLAITTTLFSLEFTFARHLFCRFGCSLGLFQSLLWMLNKKALVVGFDRSRVKECADCDKSCEIACPIKLKPRAIKRKMYSCSQCLRCIDACTSVQINTKVHDIPLLQMLDGNCALDKSARDFGKKIAVPDNCYRKP